jgi:5-methylcytosine-specific restriction endonuclease McrA
MTLMLREYQEDISATKRCTKCGEEKPLDLFASNVAKPGNKDPLCKECRNTYNRWHYHQHLEQNRLRSMQYVKHHKKEISEKNRLKYINNKEEILARNKAYDKSDAGRAASRIRNKRYRVLHPDAISNAVRRYREKNEVRYLNMHALQQRAFRKTPGGRVADTRHSHRRRTLKTQTACTLTLKQWLRILEMQNNHCAHCGVEFTELVRPTKDHIIPLSKGGGLTFGNVQALCQSCNSKKHDKVDCMIAISKLLVYDGEEV